MVYGTRADEIGRDPCSYVRRNGDGDSRGCARPSYGGSNVQELDHTEQEAGGIGDTFTIAKGPLTKRLKIIDFKRMRLEEVALHGYRHEGCASPEDFIRVYSELHPKKGWTPDEKKWVHVFEEVKD